MMGTKTGKKLLSIGKNTYNINCSYTYRYEYPLNRNSIYFHCYKNKDPILCALNYITKANPNTHRKYKNSITFPFVHIFDLKWV